MITDVSDFLIIKATDYIIISKIKKFSCCEDKVRIDILVPFISAAVRYAISWAHCKEGQGRSIKCMYIMNYGLCSAHKRIVKQCNKKKSITKVFFFFFRHAKRFIDFSSCGDVSGCEANCGKTHLNYVAVLRCKFCSRCCTSQAIVFDWVCMLVSLLLSISVTWAECSCDCRSCMLPWLTDHSNLCLCLATKLPISFYRHRRFEVIFPRIAAIDWLLNRFDWCEELFLFLQERRDGPGSRCWTEKGRKKKDR